MRCCVPWGWWTRGAARYRLRVYRGCAISCGHGAWVRAIVCVRGCWTTAIKGSVHDMVCAGPAILKRAWAISSVRGVVDHAIKGGMRHHRRCCNQTGRSISSARGQNTGFGLVAVAVGRYCSARPFYLPVDFRVPGLTLFFYMRAAAEQITTPKSTEHRQSTPPTAGHMKNNHCSFCSASVGRQIPPALLSDV